MRFSLTIALSLVATTASAQGCPSRPVVCPASSSGDPVVLYAAVAEADAAVQSEWTAQRSRRQRGQRGPRRLSAAEARFLQAGERFTCAAPQHRHATTIRYRVARVYYQADHFAEAAPRFREIAMREPTSELAEYAANLYLDSLDQLGRRDHACVLELQRMVAPLHRIYCARAADRDRHPDLCGVLQQLECNALRDEAEERASRDDHVGAAGAYLTIARGQQCDRLDEALFNAGRAYELASLHVRASRVYGALVSNFSDSPLTRPAMFQLAVLLRAAVDPEQAADMFMRFAERYPRERSENCPSADAICPDTRHALRRAMAIYRQLGADERARAASARLRNLEREATR